MTRIRVFVLLLLALSGVLCDVSKGKDSKHTLKPVEWKPLENRSTKEKRDSSELTAVYSVKQKEEPFRPFYQYHYQGVPLRATSTRYITSATTPQLSYSKPGTVIGEGPSNGGDHSEFRTVTPSSNIGGIQYASPSSYKPDGGIQYAPSAYKQSSNSGGDGIQYASSAYRGPFAATYQPASAGQVRVHSGQIYAAQPSSTHPPAAVTLPLHFGGFEQQLPPQHHQQNQYAIAFPADYLRHYQQNLAAPYPLQGAHMVPLVYAANPAQAQFPAPKDQQLKHSPVQYFTLAPSHSTSSSSAASPSSSPAPGPTVITHYIPFYGLQHHQQFQQQSPTPFYFGGHHQQAPPPATTFAYATLQPQHQAIQISPKHQIFGPYQMSAIGAAAGATVPIIPFKPIVAAQQHQQQQQYVQQQLLNNFHQQQHPGAASYTRYSQSLSGTTSSGGSGGDGGGDGGGGSGGSNTIEVPASETGSSSALKRGPLYSSTPSTSSSNIYVGATGGGSSKMSYSYGTPDGNSVGPIYTHPGAIHYGTHLYHPPTKVVDIGSNRVTAGSAAIAGVAPPAYHPQLQSTAGNSHASGVSSPSPVVKFS